MSLSCKLPLLWFSQMAAHVGADDVRLQLQNMRLESHTGNMKFYRGL